jgi:hypothetical protein
MRCTSLDHDDAALVSAHLRERRRHAIDRVWIAAVLSEQAGCLGPCAQPSRRLRDVARNLADLELSDNASTAPRWRIVAGQRLKRDNTRDEVGDGQ